MKNYEVYGPFIAIYYQFRLLYNIFYIHYRVIVWAVSLAEVRLQACKKWLVFFAPKHRPMVKVVVAFLDLLYHTLQLLPLDFQMVWLICFKPFIVVYHPTDLKQEVHSLFFYLPEVADKMVQDFIQDIGSFFDLIGYALFDHLHHVLDSHFCHLSLSSPYNRWWFFIQTHQDIEEFKINLSNDR